MEVTHGALSFVARAGVDGAGESELSVVGDVERIFKVARLDHRQHRPKDLFLRDARIRSDIGDHRGLEVVAASRVGDGIATGEEMTFMLADLNILEDRLHGAFAYYG